jgi:hypothetical protein
LPALDDWSGVQAIRPRPDLQILPDAPLRLQTAAGGAVSSGIIGDPAGTIRLQRWKGHVRGVVRSPRFGTFLMTQAPGQAARVVALDPDTLVGCDAALVGVDGDGDDPDAPAAPPPADGDAPDGDDGGVIDLLVAYTPSAHANAGSTEAMEAAIHGWVNECNDVYRNSDSAARVRLVGTAATSFVESGSYSSMLSKLASPSDGDMDELHTTRDAVGADVVMLIVTDSSSCGIGYTIKNDVSGMPHAAFAVVRDYCADVQFSFVHELGHVMGCCHDADHPGSCAGGASLYPHSFGHRFAGATDDWRTVMAYTDSSSDPWTPQVSYTRIGLLSNPDIDHDATPCGTTTADNAATHDSMRSVTAAYRAAVTPITCPGDLGDDAVVGVDDLLDLLGFWGSLEPSVSGSLRADLNGDAFVDTDDLLVLLAEFGPCPA